MSVTIKFYPKEESRKLEISDDILWCIERVLNPAAHWNDVPLYEAEVKKALDLIKQLESKLTEGKG